MLTIFNYANPDIIVKPKINSISDYLINKYTPTEWNYPISLPEGSPGRGDPVVRSMTTVPVNSNQLEYITNLQNKKFDAKELFHNEAKKLASKILDLSKGSQTFDRHLVDSIIKDNPDIVKELLKHKDNYVSSKYDYMVQGNKFLDDIEFRNFLEADRIPDSHAKIPDNISKGPTLQPSEIDDYEKMLSRRGSGRISSDFSGGRGSVLGDLKTNIDNSVRDKIDKLSSQSVDEFRSALEADRIADPNAIVPNNIPKGSTLPPKTIGDLKTNIEHSVPSLEKGLLKSFGETLAKHPGKFGLGGAATAGALYGGKKAYDHFTKEDPVTTTIDTTQDTLSDNPYLLPGVAGLVGTALAGGALYSYLKNKKKQNS